MRNFTMYFSNVLLFTWAFIIPRILGVSINSVIGMLFLAPTVIASILLFTYGLDKQNKTSNKRKKI